MGTVPADFIIWISKVSIRAFFDRNRFELDYKAYSILNESSWLDSPIMRRNSGDPLFSSRADVPDVPMTLHQMIYNQTLADRSLSPFRGSAQDSQHYWETSLENPKSKAKEGGGGEGDESELVSVACTANCRIGRPISLLMIGESSQLDSLRIEYAL